MFRGLVGSPCSDSAWLRVLGLIEVLTACILGENSECECKVAKGAYH